MISFANDYLAGAHPAILQRLAETNLESLAGYGTDPYCESAREKIGRACGCPQADVHFLMGGTQTNRVVIDSFLQPYQGVVSVETGHIGTHEGGAIEASGHKVLTLPNKEGKILAERLEELLRTFYQDENHEHMVFPGMVYLSHPTEAGTLYTKEELTAISSVCKNYELPLYLDGARLGYGLMSLSADVTLEDVARLCDAFYIGGTKVGALCGEAVVFTRGNAPKHFMTRMKQQGALLAKGRLLGLQFDTLFTDELYFTISRHAILMAEKLKEIFKEKGYSFAWESPTNQQFVLLENIKMEELSHKAEFCFWEKADETHTVVRFATSWSTSEEDLEFLRSIL